MDAVRRLAHAFLAAGDDDLAVAGQDRLIAERHRAQPGAAQLVDAVGGGLERDAGGDGGLPCRVLSLAGGEDLAQDNLRHLARLDLGAAQGLDDRDLPQLMRRQAGEPAIERADWGAGGAGDDDVGHEGISSRNLRRGREFMWAEPARCKSARQAESVLRDAPRRRRERSSG